MADTLHFEYHPGRMGRQDGAPGVVVSELTQLDIANVIARRQQADAVSQAAQHAHGTVLPMRPSLAAGHDYAFAWSGPGHWLAIGRRSEVPVETRLGATLGAHAAIVDQGGSRILLELGGPRVRELLAKGVAIDLHPSAFRTGDVAVTMASHLPVHLWQVSDEPVYRLLVVRTWFDSLWRWLAVSAAEYGCEVRPPRPYTAHQA